MDDIKVKGHPGLYRRDAAIVNKDCNYTAALTRLKKQKKEEHFEQRLDNLENTMQQILDLLMRGTQK